jgi:hypothetical protein
MNEAEDFPVSDILTEPPEEEGDNSEAGGGKPVDPVGEDEIEDTAPLDDDDVEDDDEFPGP